MQIVEANSDTRIMDGDGRPAFTLHAGRRYVLYDHEAALGVEANALEILGSIDRLLGPYLGQPLQHQRLLLPFIGRQGDALVTAACLHALVAQRPHISIDIACRPAARDVFEVVPRFGELLDYPLSAHRLDIYDYHLSFEEIESQVDGQHQNLMDLFQNCLHTPKPSVPAPIVLASEFRIGWRISESGRKRVAIHVGRRSNLRSYPWQQITELTSLLVKHDIEVLLVGHDEFGAMPPVPNEMVRDLRGCTATPADLAAILEQVDAAVVGDSFPMHLVGALGIPSVALFTASSPILAAGYPRIRTLASGEACSPCFDTSSHCPQGHNTCIAHGDQAISPGVVASHVIEILAGSQAGLPHDQDAGAIGIRRQRS
ncbi:MAG: glycosyltransferase family 9 protein [Planctomycetota bacterium]|jgi:ADP-heptose:LPS heptosyltransferase